MQKFAKVRELWPAIYEKLKNPPQGINLGSFPSKLPPMNKIVLESSSPQGKGSAVGYVSTEDVNADGKIDAIHVVVPNLEQHLQNITVSDLKGSDVNKIYQVLLPFIEVISHELGHIKDFKKDSEEPFPGQEGVAEQTARQAINETSVKASEIIFKLVKLSSDIKDENFSNKIASVTYKFSQSLLELQKNLPLEQKQEVPQKEIQKEAQANFIPETLQTEQLLNDSVLNSMFWSYNEKRPFRR